MIKDSIMKLLVILVCSLPLTSNALDFYTNKDKPGVLLVQGEFTPEDDVRFEKYVERNKINKVIWNSLGGTMTPSISIGLYMREHHIDSVVEKTGVCFSACAYAFMGGENRTVEDGGQIAMHRPYFIQEVEGTFNEGYEDGVNTSLLVINYLSNMGLDYEYTIGHLLFEELVPLSKDLIALYNVSTQD